jgi:predicted hotdog family 3-hydroxylacyl-ACP dehydratase
MKPILKGEEVLHYIPQRPPIVMIDTLWSTDEVSTTGGLTVLADNIFVENNHLAEPGLMEHIAQTAALRAGYFFKSQQKEVPLGFIGSFKDLIIQELPTVGSTLHTKVSLLHEVMDISVFKGEVFHKETCIASCEIKIFVLDKSATND